MTMTEYTSEAEGWQIQMSWQEIAHATDGTPYMASHAYPAEIHQGTMTSAKEIADRRMLRLKTDSRGTRFNVKVTCQRLKLKFDMDRIAFREVEDKHFTVWDPDWQSQPSHEAAGFPTNPGEVREFLHKIGFFGGVGRDVGELDVDDAREAA